MSLQIGPALRDGATNIASRTGAILLAAYVTLTVGLLPISNTMIARIYESAGISEAAGAIPLVLGLPLPVAVGGYLVGLVVGSYLSIVAIRTFVADAPDSFPDGAFTRNVPLAIANLVVGGFVYGLLVAVGSVLLLVPGIIAYLAFLFMLPYVAVEDRNFVDALQSSYRLSKGHWLVLFALVVVIFGFSIGIGFVGGFVSVFLPQPVGQLSLAVVQSPMSLYTLSVIAAAFTQLKDGEGERSGATPAAETPSTPA